MKLGEQIQKLNTRVCSYQKDRLNAADVIDGVTLLTGTVQHLPRIIEETVTRVCQDYHLKEIKTVVSVDCCEICTHGAGIHIFLETDMQTDEISYKDVSTVVRSALQCHVAVKEIVIYETKCPVTVLY